MTVKTLGDGSARLQDLEPGTWVLAEGPYGAMTAQRRTRRNVLLVAGGVGITPMRALFETHAARARTRTCCCSTAPAPSGDLIFQARARPHRPTTRVRGCSYLVGDGLASDTKAFRAMVPGPRAARRLPVRPAGAVSRCPRRRCAPPACPSAQLHEERFAF